MMLSTLSLSLSYARPTRNSTPSVQPSIHRLSHASFIALVVPPMPKEEAKTGRAEAEADAPATASELGQLPRFPPPIYNIIPVRARRVQIEFPPSLGREREKKREDRVTEACMCVCMSIDIIAARPACEHIYSRTHTADPEKSSSPHTCNFSLSRCVHVIYLHITRL